MKQLIETIKEIASQARFASLTYKTKEKKNAAGMVVDGGEISRYTLILGAEYKKQIEDSLLSTELLTDSELAEMGKNKGIDLATMRLAKEELIDSFKKTLAFNAIGQQNPDYTKNGLYINLCQGLNLNPNDNTLQLFGLVQAKVTLQEGIHKMVKSAPLTIAKNVIRKTLPVGRWREFALDLGNVQGARLNGETIEIE